MMDEDSISEDESVPARNARPTRVAAVSSRSSKRIGRCPQREC